MNPKAIGFTGTRNRLTEIQLNQMVTFVRSWRNLYNEVHHGACVGADESFALAANLHTYHVVAHPPEVDAYLSLTSLEVSSLILPAKPYHDRNHDIVDASALLLAMPIWPENKAIQSGTWSTIRYARTLNRPIFIIHSDGEAVRENYD